MDNQKSGSVTCGSDLNHASNRVVARIREQSPYQGFAGTESCRNAADPRGAGGCWVGYEPSFEFDVGRLDDARDFLRFSAQVFLELLGRTALRGQTKIGEAFLHVWH